MESNTLVSVPKIWWAYFWRCTLISLIALSVFGWVLPMSIDLIGITFQWTPLHSVMLKVANLLIILPISYLVFKAVVPKLFSPKENQ